MNDRNHLTLVNPDRIRDTLKRQFDGSAHTVLGELLQNSQRSGSSEVHIIPIIEDPPEEATSKEHSLRYSRLVYADDGTGLIGREGFKKLICLGDSYYENPSVEQNQLPMGVGFNSLLANEKVTKVVIESNNFLMEIDTHRWWNDIEYAKTCEIKSAHTPELGIILDIYAESEFIEEIIDLLSVGDTPFSGFKYDWKTHVRKYPAWGYHLICLEILLNSRTVYNGYPRIIQDENILIETEYLAQRLVIFESCSWSSTNIHAVNWYGQIIAVDCNLPFGFLLEVSSGKPVNPRSPVREGLIFDRQYQELLVFIASAIAVELCSLNTTFATAKNIKAFYQLAKLFPQLVDVDRCPYFVARQYESFTGEDFGDLDTCDEETVLLYENAPLLVEPQVVIVEGNRRQSLDYGISNFISFLERSAYQFVCGVKNNLEILQIFWQPGEAIAETNQKLGYYFQPFHQRGNWAIVKKNEEPYWQPVEGDVFLFDRPDGNDIEFVENLHIGCENPVRAIEQMGMACFDGEYENACQEEYRRSVDRIIRTLMGNAIPRTFNYCTLVDFVAKQTGWSREEIEIIAIIPIMLEGNNYPSGYQLQVKCGKDERVLEAQIYQ
jgi:hypothetical protein